MATTERHTLTVEEAAAMLGISRGLAYEAARNGDLPTIRLGRRYVVPRARLLELLGESEDPLGQAGLRHDHHAGSGGEDVVQE